MIMHWIFLAPFVVLSSFCFSQTNEAKESCQEDLDYDRVIGINDLTSLSATFGERFHLEETADWGPLPWDDYVNYGTYEFEERGIFIRHGSLYMTLGYLSNLEVPVLRIEDMPNLHSELF